MRHIGYKHLTAILLQVVLLAGCRSVHDVDRAESDELSAEGTVVFVRPTEYALLGTKSLSDYIEVVYERAQRNDAGLLEIRLGLRNRGGQHFWDVKGPDFPISAQTAFYEEPVAGQTHHSPPIYETNWQRVQLVRGAATNYTVVCPVKAGAYYQITLSELK